MGNSNGLELLSFIKCESPGIGCVMMTAHRDVDYAVKALRDGVDDHLFKPIDPVRLLELMATFFNKRRIKQQEISKERNLKTTLDQTSGFIFLLSPSGLCIEASHTALFFMDQRWDQIVGRVMLIRQCIRLKRQGRTVFNFTVDNDL